MARGLLIKQITNPKCLFDALQLPLLLLKFGLLRVTPLDDASSVELVTTGL